MGRRLFVWGNNRSRKKRRIGLNLSRYAQSSNWSVNIIHNMSNTAVETTTIVASRESNLHFRVLWPSRICGEPILFKCKKYFRDDLTLAMVIKWVQRESSEFNSFSRQRLFVVSIAVFDN